MMIESLALLVFVVTCAFIMGYAVNQGSTCAVTAAKELVHQRTATLLTGFAVAVGTAGLICLPLSWIFGSAVHLTGGTTIHWPLIAGSMLLGLGAVVNDACLFGTLSRIGHGEVRFLALPAGLAIGFLLAGRQSLLMPGPPVQNPLAEPSAAGFAIVIGFAAMLAVAWYWLGKTQDSPGRNQWPLRWAMAMLGLCGALLFAVAPGWTYADALERAVGISGNPMAIGFGPLIAAIAVLLGALAASFRARVFVLQRPTWANVSRSLVGGTIMAFGGTLVPGGNDSLLLASLPALALSGITAYVVMSVTVPLLLLLLQIVQRNARKSGLKPS